MISHKLSHSVFSLFLVFSLIQKDEIYLQSQNIFKYKHTHIFLYKNIFPERKQEIVKWKIKYHSSKSPPPLIFI